MAPSLCFMSLCCIEKYEIKKLVSCTKNKIQAKQWLDKCYSDFALLETMVER